MTHFLKYLTASLCLVSVVAFIAPSACAQDTNQNNAKTKKTKNPKGHVDYKSPPSPEALAAKNQASPVERTPVSAAPPPAARKAPRKREMSL